MSLLSLLHHKGDASDLALFVAGMACVGAILIAIGVTA